MSTKDMFSKTRVCFNLKATTKNEAIDELIDLLEKDGKLTGGTILDPKTGKIYKCNITLDKEAEKLTVRGSLDKGGWIGRSQTWIRSK